MKKAFLLAALCACAPAGFSQNQPQPGKAYSADTKTTPADAPRPPKPKTVSAAREPAIKVKLPKLDPAKATADKNARAVKRQVVGGTQTLPDAIVVANPPGAGWEKLADGRWLWLAEISADSAQAIRLQITELKLPAGAALRVYAPKSTEAEMEHTAATLQGRNELWTESVFGDTARIEIVLPANWSGEAVSAKIAQVVNRWKALVVPTDETELAKAAGACNLDVSCFPAWVNTSKAVVGFGAVDDTLEIFCTGTLLADASNAPGTDFLLTANHCISNQGEAATTEFFWLYQTGACNGAPPALASVPRTVGAQLIATSTEFLGNDFSFLRLNTAPPAGVTYAGWTTSAPVGAVTTIHHPSGEHKRISFGTSTADDHYWRIVWNQGTTEAGSSGSAIFDSNQRIVGQLNGGDASCANPTGFDWYGRFDVTFATIGNWLTAQPTAAPNDNFANAVAISGATGFVTGTSAGATKEPNEPQHGLNTGGMSVWYRWTAPTAGRYMFSTGGSGFDTVLGVYVGNSIDTLNQVARGDDSFGLTSVATFNAVAGGVYYIGVDGYNGQGGMVQVNWSPIQVRSFVSAAPITIRDLNTALPYPSTITINNVPGVIAELGARLEGITHGYLSDVSVLLHAPSGEAMMLMDYVGQGVNATDLNIILHPQATQYLPPQGPLPSNATWLPTAYLDDTILAPPAPEPGFYDLNAVFGADPNGVWSLYIEDFEQGDSGVMNRWQLDLGTYNPDVRITAIRQLGPDSLELRWTAIPAFDYQILFKNDLSEATWQVLDTTTAAADAASYIVPRNGLRGFYLIKEI